MSALIQLKIHRAITGVVMDSNGAPVPQACLAGTRTCSEQNIADDVADH